MQGILLINKEINKTSRDMVNELVHIFNTKKIGHTGTLDPIATGVLVMCIGKYTKLVDELSSITKEYIAKIKVGIKTDTLDITGNILERKHCEIDKKQLLIILNNMCGKFIQTIPKYSAKKINGKKLYEYARKNIDITLPTNEIEIFDAKLINIINDEIEIKFIVSKGTYIRSLIEYIVNELNIIGTMSSLTRTKQGKFSINDSYTINQVANNKYSILKLQDICKYKLYNLDNNEYQRVKNGNILYLNFEDNKIICVYNSMEIALYKKENNYYKADVMLI